MTSLLNALIWVVNGFVVILFFMVDHLATALLIPAAAAFVSVTPEPQRGWAVGAGVLALAANLAAPPPVPVFLVVIAAASAAAFFLEHYNRPAVLWNIVRSVCLYSLAGLGYGLWRSLSVMDSLQGDALTSQGAVYLNAIVAIAMYAIPLGIVVLVAQSVLAHPPVGRPDQILTHVRTRGKDR